MNDMLKKNYMRLAISLSCVLADEQEALMIEAPHPKEMLCTDELSEDKFCYVIKKKVGSPARTLEKIEDLGLYLKKNWSDLKKLESYILKAFEYDNYFLITIERG